MIRKIDSNKFSLTILKVTTFSRIRQEHHPLVILFTEVHSYSSIVSSISYILLKNHQTRHLSQNKSLYLH